MIARNRRRVNGVDPVVTEPPTTRFARLTGHRAFRWAERLFWVALAGFVLVRLGPQISALTGVGPTLGTAPSFEFTTLDGTVLTDADLRGRVVVVNFWATWCTPCRIEVPALQKLHEARAADGVVVLGAATDVGGARVVRPFVEERDVTYPVGVASRELRRAFGGITALPTTFIIDREGVIRHRVFGFFAPPAMNAAVGRLLEEG
jgi:thiol-disulfide isomerase/thioredoxin